MFSKEMLSSPLFKMKGLHKTATEISSRHNSLLNNNITQQIRGSHNNPEFSTVDASRSLTEAFDETFVLFCFALQRLTDHPDRYMRGRKSYRGLNLIFVFLHLK